MSAQYEYVPATLADVKPDLKVTQAFLTDFAGSTPITFRVIHPDGRTRMYHGTLKEHKTALIRDNKAGFNIYFMINEGDGKGTSAENVVRVRGALVDFDDPENVKLVWDAMNASPLTLGPVIETSPAKFHAHLKLKGWPVTNTEQDAKRYEQVADQLSEFFGSDDSVFHLCQLGRLPGFWHVKGVPTFPSCIIRATGDTYTVDEVTAAFDQATPLPKRPSTKPAPPPKRDGPYKPMDVVPDGFRGTEMTRFAGSRRGKPHGDDDDKLLVQMRTYNEVFDPPWSDAKVERKCRYYCRKFEQWQPDLLSHNSLISPTYNSENCPDPLGKAAYHGVVGAIVRTIEPHTEADPTAILVQTLVALGNAVGPAPHFMVEADKHRLNLNAVLAGTSSKARKGTSWGRARYVAESVDPSWKPCIKSGLSSGEGLIWAVRDPIEGMVKQKGQEPALEVVDPGVEDKRLLVVESEFAKVLRVFERQGNTLASVIRDMWDHGNASSMVKTSPACTTGAHVSILGHITQDELLRYLDSTEAASGLANRFLWFYVKRSKELPEGGTLANSELVPFVKDIRDAFEAAKGFGPITRDAEARELWCSEYHHLSRERAGLVGALTSRAEAQTMRLACLYAVLDGSHVIQLPHLQAALEVWRYAEQSVEYIFGDSLGDPVADTILRAIRRDKDGMTRTAISALLGRHQSATQIDRAISLLMKQSLAKLETVETAGRPAERLVAT